MKVARKSGIIALLEGYFCLLPFFFLAAISMLYRLSPVDFSFKGLLQTMYKIRSITSSMLTDSVPNDINYAVTFVLPKKGLV